MPETRIYEDIDSITGLPSGMINFDNGSGIPLFSEPKGSLSIVAGTATDGSTRVFIKRRDMTDILPPLKLTEILDSTGTVWGSTLTQVRAALNRFFFEAPTLDMWQVQGAGSDYYTNGQKNDQSTYINSSNLVANTLYAFPFLCDGTITNLAVEVAVGVGKLIFGIYDSSANQKPNNKVWQIPTEIDNTVATTYTYTQTIGLKMGLYWFVLHTNATFNLKGIPVAQVFNNMGYDLGNSRDYNHYTAALAYNATLPDPTPIFTPQGAGFSVPALFFKKAA